MKTPGHAHASALVARLGSGGVAAAQELFPYLYEELRALARTRVQFQHASTLQPTELVHEAFLRLSNGEDIAPASRTHFMALAGKVMHDVLADRFRRDNAIKRGRDWRRVTLRGVFVEREVDELDLVSLSEALKELEQLDSKQARIVELRFFADLMPTEIAQLLDVSVRSVQRELRMARAWLLSEMEGSESS